eukprot:scaffold45662_cov260-Amphora_coffeaeformis.AAC.4
MPEIEFFKYLDLEETFGRLYYIFKKKWSVFLSITAIAHFVIEAVTVATLAVFWPLLLRYQSNQSYNDGNTKYYIRFIILQMLDSAIYFGIMCIGDGAIIRAVAEMYVVGAIVGIPAAIVLFFVVGASGMTSTVFAFTVVLALACAFFSGWVLVATYHMYPSIVIEDQGILRSISRSVELSSGQRWYIFTRLIVLFVVKGVFKQIFLSIAASGSEGAAFLQAIVYFSVRVEKEKLNQSGLTTELSGTNASRNEAPYVSADDAGMANSESTSLPVDGKDVV